MKIALCLYGVVGGTTGKADYAQSSLDILKLGYQKYKESLLDHYDVDIYLHTWSKELEKEILELYKPKKHLIEEQEVFDIPSYVSGDDPEQPKRRQGCYSRWRSTQKVLNLKDSSGEKYDFTFVTRFDVAFENKIDFESLEKGKLYLSNWWSVSYKGSPDIFEDGRGIYYEKESEINEDELTFYGRGYPYKDEGFMDLWMIGSDETISIFNNLFDNINQYQKEGGFPRISNHLLLLYHIYKSDLLNQVTLISNPLKDHAIIRYKYFGCKDSYITTLLRSS